MNKSKVKEIIICAILFLLPCIFFWLTVGYFSIFGLEVEPFTKENNIEEGFVTPIIAKLLNSFNTSDGLDFTVILFFLIIFLIFLWLVVLGMVFFSAVLLFEIPIMMFIFSFKLPWLFIWFFIIAFCISIVSAFLFKFGKFDKTESCVTGYHYEGEIKGDTVKIKEVEDRSDGGAWIKNVLLLMLRIFLILVGGIIIFIKRIKPVSDSSSSEE